MEGRGRKGSGVERGEGGEGTIGEGNDGECHVRTEKVCVNGMDGSSLSQRTQPLVPHQSLA